MSSLVDKYLLKVSIKINRATFRIYLWENILVKTCLEVDRTKLKTPKGYWDRVSRPSRTIKVIKRCCQVMKLHYLDLKLLPSLRHGESLAKYLSEGKSLFGKILA